MDYNSYPWTYEVVGIGADGTRYSETTCSESMANELYDKFTNDFKTALLSKSRLGVVKGTPGL
jgi:hypothetical protein